MIIIHKAPVNSLCSSEGVVSLRGPHNTTCLPVGGLELSRLSNYNLTPCFVEAKQNNKALGISIVHAIIVERQQSVSPIRMVHVYLKSSYG